MHCEECGQPVSPILCQACRSRQASGIFSVANRWLPDNPVRYIMAIARSRLYVGLLLLAITPILLLTVHINMVVGMMVYFSLFWFFVFQPLLADHIQLSPLVVDIGAYIFTGLVGTSFAMGVESFWYGHGGRGLLNSPALVVAAPAYILFVGVTEEVAKQLVVIMVMGWQRTRKKVWPALSYMMLGVSSGLGFSAVENISYVQRGIAFEVMRHAFGLGTFTALTRALYTPFLHAIWAGTAAWGIGQVAAHGSEKWRVGSGLMALVAIFHGIYDSAISRYPGVAILDVAVSYLVFLALLLNGRRRRRARTVL